MREKRGTTFFSKISSRKDVNSYSTSREAKKRKRRASVTALRIIMNSQYGARTSVATAFSNWATLMAYDGCITFTSMRLAGLKRSSVTGDLKIEAEILKVKKELKSLRMKRTLFIKKINRSNSDTTADPEKNR